MTKVYLAGPLFTSAEQEFNRQLRNALQNRGHEVWLPQEREPANKTAKEIFYMDVSGIEWADAVVANMDGPDPDSGTCWECAYAYAKFKPVHLFRTDFRSAGDAALSPFNLMLSQSASNCILRPLGTPEELAAYLDNCLESSS